MLSSGIGLIQSFESLCSGEKNEEQLAQLKYITLQIKQGKPLHAAFFNSKLVPVFDIPLIEAGEKSGTLTKIFSLLSQNYNQAAEAEKNIRKGLTKPFWIFTLALFVPNFPKVFTGQISGTVYLTTNGVLIGIILGTTFIGYKLFMKSYFDIELAKKRHQILCGLPFFRNLAKLSAVEKFITSLAMMLEAGIPIIDAIGLAGKTSADRGVSGAAKRISLSLKSGKPLPASFRTEYVFNTDIQNSILIGNESGKLPEMLERSAGRLKKQVSDSIERMSKVIPQVVYWFVVFYVAATIIGIYLVNLKELSKMLGE
jgi:type IV pilus assembly protein PilC